jgi:hypothetical protein
MKFPIDLAKRQIMGNEKNTRLRNEIKKILIEDCIKIDIYSLKPNLISRDFRKVSPSIVELETENIEIEVFYNKLANALKIYHSNKEGGEKNSFTQIINLTNTNLYWGGIRYWFICPMENCKRRVGCLFLPPEKLHFGCRHCWKLTYLSSQNKKKYAEIKQAILIETFSNEKEKKPEPIRRILSSHSQSPNRNQTHKPPNYLNKDQLCEKSGLSQTDLIHLEEARLLLPDKSIFYRPKLVSWGRKLAYLINAGWSMSEIKAWSRSRWETNNPRLWPPDRYY